MATLNILNPVSPDFETITNETRVYPAGARAYSFLLSAGSATIAIGDKAAGALPLGYPVGASFIGQISVFDEITITATAGTVFANILY